MRRDLSSGWDPAGMKRSLSEVVGACSLPRFLDNPPHKMLCLLQDLLHPLLGRHFRRGRVPFEEVVLGDLSAQIGEGGKIGVVLYDLLEEISDVVGALQLPLLRDKISLQVLINRLLEKECSISAFALPESLFDLLPVPARFLEPISGGERTVFLRHDLLLLSSLTTFPMVDNNTNMCVCQEEIC